MGATVVPHGAPGRFARALRIAALGLALVHTFPARRHLALFLDAPSFAEGWKGFGALVAIGFYLLPTRWQARALTRIWTSEWSAFVVGLVLASAHAVPVLDHVPRFLAEPSWADAWRGGGAAIASAWFAAPTVFQRAAFRKLASAFLRGRMAPSIH